MNPKRSATTDPVQPGPWASDPAFRRVLLLRIGETVEVPFDREFQKKVITRGKKYRMAFRTFKTPTGKLKIRRIK